MLRSKYFFSFLFRLDCSHTVHGEVQLLDDVKQKTRYWNLRQDALDRTVWRTIWQRLWSCLRTHYAVNEYVSIIATLNYTHNIVIFSNVTG
jgi:hypothetical protein